MKTQKSSMTDLLDTLAGEPVSSKKKLALSNDPAIVHTSIYLSKPAMRAIKAALATEEYEDLNQSLLIEKAVRQLLGVPD